MNKNLKKVISSVIALALSLSSVAALAASYTDVPATANYASAVSNLSALKVINGYEDGSFKPDSKVTRAEVTKMVVAALNQTSAAQSSKTGTIFTDVTADHWASGFINVGVNSTGFINGMGNGTFMPEGNVTYAQIVKMLVAAVGYGNMAVQQGGYPTGYMTVADSRGITAGVTGVSANDEVTRAQVAMLINNAIDTPLLVNTVWSPTDPEFEIKDGDGEDYQTLLTNKFNAYKVEGRVTATNKSDSSVDLDQVNFDVEVAKNFDDVKYTRNDAPASITAYIGDTMADSYLLTYASAIVQIDENDDYRLISITPSGKNVTTEVASAGFDEDNTNYSTSVATSIVDDGKALYYYANSDKTGKVSTYKLATTPKLFVNGVEVTYDVANVEKYVVNGMGKATLIDAPAQGSSTTDGKYDYIFTQYYGSALVDYVSTAGKVYLKSYENGMASSFELDEDEVKDGDLSYSVTLDGKSIAKTDLQTDDVVTIAYDVTASSFQDSAFYDILVTRGTVDGKVTSYDSDNGYTVGGKNYKSIEDRNGDYINVLAVGSEYSMYVNALGKIVDFEELATSNKYAIMESVYEVNDGSGDYKARLVLPNGTVNDYILKNSTDVSAYTAIVYTNNVSGAKEDIQDRVVTYKVNSDNKIYSVQSEAGKATATGDTYSERNVKIGTVKLNSAVAMLDTSEYTTSTSDIVVTDKSKLVDDTEYTAYGFDKADDGTYRFVIITDGVGGYADDTQVAVYWKTFSTTDANGDVVSAVKVYYKGQQQDIVVDSDFSSANPMVDANNTALQMGDAIVFTTNASGEIDTIDKVMTLPTALGNGYTTFQNYVMANTASDFSALLTAVSDWKTTSIGSDIGLVFGPIVDKTTKMVTLARPASNGVSNEDNDVDYTLNSDTKVYVYDYSKTSDQTKLYVGGIGDIIKTSVPSAAKDTDAGTIDWNYADVKTQTNYAFAKIDDEVVTEIYVILADN